MAITEHPGWREFPLEIGQAVRSDQINALWWALSERAAVVGFTPIETNFGIFDSGTGEFVRYRGDSRLCLIKAGGESEINANNHLAVLRAATQAIIPLYVNSEINLVTGEEAEADEELIEGDVQEPPFERWTLSDILKFLELGGPQEGFSSSDPDALFTWTRIPDRETQVIGKDADGMDVTFNDFFGDPEFAAVVSSDPTFKEHLNEIYFVIKELKFVPFDTATRSEFRSRDGQLIGDSFVFATESNDFLESWLVDRPELFGNTVFGAAGPAIGGPAVVGSGSIARITSRRFGGPMSNTNVQATYQYAISSLAELSDLPFPVFPNRPKVIGENNDLPSPYEYGEIHAFVRITQARFTEDETSNGQPIDSSSASFENPVLKAILPDDLVEGTGTNDITDIQQGEEVLSFDLTVASQIADPDPEEQFTKEIDIQSVQHLLPTALLLDDGGNPIDFDDATSDDFDRALRLWFAGSLDDYGGDILGLGPPEDEFHPDLAGLFGDVERKFRFSPITGFFEITNFTHQDRTRDPLPPCFPSGQTC